MQSEQYAPEGFEGVDTSLPHSLQDERYAVGVCLASTRAATYVSSRLAPEDFLIPLNRKAYEAVQALVDREEGVTLTNIANEIKRQLPAEDENNPFESFHIYELTAAFEKEEHRDVRSINASIARLKELTGYRRLIESSKIVLARAYRREPLHELISIYEETGLAIARSAYGESIVRPEQAARDVDGLYTDLREGKLTTLPTAYPELNRILWGGGFWGGDNIIVAGETSTGKTTLALNIATDAALMGKRVLYFSREMGYKKLLIRVHSRLAKVPAWKIAPDMDEGVRERLRRTMDLIDSLPIFWDDRTADIRSIRRKAKDYTRNEGVDLIVLDYLKLLLPPPGFRGSTADRLSAISREVKDGATETNRPWIDIAQLRRPYGQERTDENPEPTLDRLKDSGDIENDADTVIMLWRNKKEQEEGVRLQTLDAYAKVAKQRQGELGRFKLKFAPDIYSFSSIEQLEDEKKRLEGAKF